MDTSDLSPDNRRPPKPRPSATGGDRPAVALATPPAGGLQAVPRGRVSERVVEEIRGYIAHNGLGPGHRLPPERVFIDLLGVGRSSLREALRVLTTLGVIEVRHGDGMYVAAATDAVTGSPAAIFDATEQDALRNLVETRLGIELAAAIAATQRATDEDLAGLERFLDEQEQRLRTDPDHRWEPLAFELAVVEITGNSWLNDVEVMLRDAWVSLSEGLLSSVGRHREWLSEHRAILASMRSRNVAQVQRLVIAHVSLQRFEEDMQASTVDPSLRPRATRPGTGRTRA